MPRPVIISLGNFAQQPAQNGFNFGQVGLDAAYHHRFNIGALDGLDRGRIKLRMIHTKHGFGTGIFQLVIKFVGRVQGIAGHTNRTGFNNSEKKRRIVGNIRQKYGYPIPLLNAAGNQKTGNPISGILYLGIGTRGIIKNGVNLVGIIAGRVIKD